jgi:hypothetical protein
MLRDQLGPVLRRHGYKGSGSTWVLTTPNGDRAVVNAQSSSSSSKAEVLFIINLAVVPQPWWDWNSERLNAKPTRKARDTDGLWRDRLRARRGVFDRGGDPWWSVRDSPSPDLAVVM